MANACDLEHDPTSHADDAGELIQRGHCGYPITGEQKRKATKSGDRFYNY